MASMIDSEAFFASRCERADDLLGEGLPLVVSWKRTKMVPRRGVLVGVGHIPTIEEDDLVVGKISETIKVRTQRL